VTDVFAAGAEHALGAKDEFGRVHFGDSRKRALNASVWVTAGAGCAGCSSGLGYDHTAAVCMGLAKHFWHAAK